MSIDSLELIFHHDHVSSCIPFSNDVEIADAGSVITIVAAIVLGLILAKTLLNRASTTISSSKKNTTSIH